MPDSPILTSLALAAVFIVVLLFAVGTQRNVRRGNAVLRWLQGGLPALGSRTTLRWLGSSAVELTLIDPAPPFREVTVVVVMEPRDIPWLWAASRRRGRRDLIIVRARLRRAPPAELEVADPATWSARLPIQPSAAGALAPIEWPDSDGRHLSIEASDRLDVAAARRAWRSLDAASGGAWRLSVRQTVPHLEIHVRPPGPDASAPKLVEAIRQVAFDLGGRDSSGST